MKLTKENKLEQKEPSPKVVLGEIEKEDIEIMYEWFGDVDFLKFYDYVAPVPLSKEQVDEMFNYYKNSEKSKVFAIKLLKNNQLIGLAGFDDIVKDNCVATLFIGLGSKDTRGKGYGREALKLLLNYGFNELDFHRIQLNVLEFNKAAIALYEKSGFIKEGTYRDFVLRDNKRYDLLLYGLLKREWEKQKISN